MYTDPSGYSLVDWIKYLMSAHVPSGTTLHFDNGEVTSISWGGGGGSAWDYYHSFDGMNSGLVPYSINGHMITGAERWFWVKFFSHFGTNTFLEPSRNTTPPSFEPFDPENLLASTDKQIKPPSPAGQGGGQVKPGFDIDKAVDYINANAHSKSQGACSRYVQNALVAGGITDAKTQPVKAGGAYGPLLTKWGFTMITTTLDNYTPVKGDIGVIQGYPGGTPCAAGPCGHIQMYNGTQWVSDYLQSTNRPFYPGPTYQQNAPAFEIYRW